VVALLMLLAACSDEATGPQADRPGSGFGRGTSTTTDGTASLIGVWRNVTVIQVPGDVQTLTTVWEFDDGGTCRQTVTTESLAEGFPRTTDRTCTFVVNGSDVTISFAGGGTLTVAFSFAGFDPDRLVLDGFEYQRQT
jgi:hypothetical protein